ncbi:hypothetical protein J4E93_002584 [Alternaria ventricosa]|uniref:uncharacterized protein n=1 Tax=Alternaria ventricosa TaxID=1187951 RepID=UPI0020C5353D|nr:uncharacterized protein J4E93_002584 [Alternaria ventricosa]KAI4652382.1 hypothetical protein J4E93_002584 [Alternaria ventricosa]
MDTTRVVRGLAHIILGLKQKGHLHIMASKPSSPGPNATPATPAKQARSRKAATPSQTEQGRAGSAGGVVLPKEPTAKASASSAKKAAATTATDDVTAPAAKTPKKKPRKLNKEPISTSTEAAKPTVTSKTTADVPSPSELEALKSRVRGLEAKVEELYKAGAIPDSRPGRSPRRRGKGRKASSTAQVPTLSTTANESDSRVQEIADDEEEEADEELVRLEGELEVARQDLEHFNPRSQGAKSRGTEYIEEIDRDVPGARAGTERQVTLSGSYRIPIPANVNLEDVKTIKSGVSAAQNVARSFLEQRRAAAAVRASENNASSPQQQSSSRTTKVPASKSSSATTPKPKRSMSSTMEVAVDNSDGKQSWSEWIGGYSMAITRAVSKIEHEAAVEAQRGGGSAGASRPSAGGRRTSAPTSKKAAGKRPAAKATLSGEQVHGLMS